MGDVIERTETLAAEPAYALGGLLGVPVPDVAGGAGLPLLWHWCYLLDRPAQTDLGPDGHPVRGVLPAPPAPGLRRMWAGGRVRASGVLRCGEPATRLTRVLSMADKVGRTGPMTFVVVGHQIVQRDQVVVDEEQDIVYRAPVTAGRPAGQAAAPASAPDAADAPVVQAGDGEWEIPVSPTLLFRFSALTYNAHRIHYDRDFARDVEGYPGLLTHGPLQALAMAEGARASASAAAAGAGAGASGAPGRERSFEYRLVSPLFDHQGMVVSAVPGEGAIETAVRDLNGRQTARGTLRLAVLVGPAAHERGPGHQGHHLAVLVPGHVLEDHDALARPTRRQPLLAHGRLPVDRVAVPDRGRETRVAEAQVGHDRALGQMTDREPDQDRHRQQAVDQALAELGLLAEGGIEMQRLRVHGHRAEQRVVRLAQRPPGRVLVEDAGLELLEPQPALAHHWHGR